MSNSRQIDRLLCSSTRTRRRISAQLYMCVNTHRPRDVWGTEAEQYSPWCTRRHEWIHERSGFRPNTGDRRALRFSTDVHIRVPITGNRAKRILHGAINVKSGDVRLLITEEWVNE